MIPAWDFATLPAQLIGSIDTGSPEGDRTAFVWWKVYADGRLECIDAYDFAPSRLHETDLEGVFRMSPAGFPFIPGLAAMVLQSQPEIDYARSPAEFNDAFGPTARTRIAQERMNARLDRKRIRQERYRRMIDRRALN